MSSEKVVSLDLDENVIIDQSNLNGNVKVLSDIPNSDTCLSLKINPNGKAYAVALADGNVNVYQTHNDRLIFQMKQDANVKQRPDFSATCVRFRPFGRGNASQNNIIIATYTNGKVKTFHYPTGECVHSLNENREVLTCEFSAIADTFATSGSDGNLIIYDDETREILQVYEPPFYENRNFRRIYSIAYNPQSTDELITGGWDGVIRYYDLRIPYIVKQLYGPIICGEGLAFDATGREFCSASWRCESPLQLWDYGSSRLIKNIFPNSGGVGSERMHDKPVTGSGDRRNNALQSKSSESNSPENTSVHLPRIATGSKSKSDACSTSIVKSSKPTTFKSSGLASKLPKMLYSCRYFLNNDNILFSGTEENAVGVVNKNTGKVLTSIFGLRNSVYCVDSYHSKIALISGKGVALVHFYV